MSPHRIPDQRPSQAARGNVSKEDEMHQFYKWVIAAMATLLMVAGTTYMNNVQKSVDAQSQQLLGHEQRITTLEESKRNQEILLQEIKNTVEKIRDAVDRSR